MSERVFNYERVSEIYKNMQQIVGDKANSDSIAGILYTVDKQVNENVDVMDTALYGDLGKQLLLNWENTSANFNSYIDKFSDWCELIASTGGQYSQFEQRVYGFKETNPFGTAGVGLTSNYVETSEYADLDGESLDDLKASLLPLYSMTGAEYIDTGAIDSENSRKVWAWVDWGVSAVGVALDVVGIGFASKLATSGAKTATTSLSTVVRSNADDVFVDSVDDVLRFTANTADDVIVNSADDVLRLTSKEVIEDSGDDVIRAFVTSDPKTGKVITSYNPSARYADILDDSGKVLASYADDSVEVVATEATKATTTAGTFTSKVKETFCSFGTKLKNKITTSGLAEDVVENTAKSNVDDVAKNIIKNSDEVVEEVVSSTAAKSSKNPFTWLKGKYDNSFVGKYINKAKEMEYTSPFKMKKKDFSTVYDAVKSSK